ncbi:hypothetical protein V8D89_009823 [Ganoderma adspersum]
MATMEPHNSTIPNFGGIDVNTLALNIITHSTISAEDSVIEVFLSSLLFGVLTILSLTAIFFLIRQGSLAQTRTRMLILSTVLLYMSTGTSLIALMWNRSQANDLVLGAAGGLFSPSYDGLQEMAGFKAAVWKQSWMTAITLVWNCIIGDAIVWWRVRPWSDTPIVFGIIGYREPKIAQTTRVTLLITNNAFVKAAAAVSFSTNALATALTACKMWEHRRLVRKHFREAGTKSRVLNALGLLVECGSIYCALLIFVMVHEEDPKMSRNRAGMAFTRVVECFIYGCLTPLVAIYPTIIIVLVALKRSPIDTGGWSQVHQACGRGIGAIDDGRGSTIVFRLSTARTSAERDVEDPDTVESVCCSEPRGIHSRKSSTSEKTAQSVDTLV